MELWTSFWLGAVLGTFAGTAIGVLLTCLMVAARREPEPDHAAAVDVVRGVVDGLERRLLADPVVGPALREEMKRK